MTAAFLLAAAHQTLRVSFASGQTGGQDHFACRDEGQQAKPLGSRITEVSQIGTELQNARMAKVQLSDRCKDKPDEIKSMADRTCSSKFWPKEFIQINNVGRCPGRDDQFPTIRRPGCREREPERQFHFTIPGQISDDDHTIVSPLKGNKIACR